jgi:hypothetical protein
MNNDVVAGIDVHKAMLAVVVARPEQTETEYMSRKFSDPPRCRAGSALICYALSRTLITSN